MPLFSRPTPRPSWQVVFCTYDVVAAGIADSEIAAIRLDESHLPALQALNARCSDYAELMSGTPPDPDDARIFLTARPQGADPDDKLALGLYHAGDLVGILDAICHYPEADDWYLALMMLEPQWRGRGVGAAVYRAFEAWVRGQGGRRVYTAVLEESRAAWRFWRQQGFETLYGLPPARFGRKMHVRMVMHRRLDDFVASAPAPAPPPGPAS